MERLTLVAGHDRHDDLQHVGEVSRGHTHTHAVLQRKFRQFFVFCKKNGIRAECQ